MIRTIKRAVERLRKYEALEENLRSLRRAIETQERAVIDLHQQLDERDERIAKLRSEYQTLDQQGNDQTENMIRAERLAMFKQLQPVVTQLPTLRKALDQNADITARDVMNLLTPIDQMLADMGFVSIGEAGQELKYDPRRHHVVGKSAADIRPDEKVRVRYIGYMYDSQVVCKAEVTPLVQKQTS